MKPITAVTFILSGILLYLSAHDFRSDNYRRAQTILATLTVAIGAFTLIGFAFLTDFNIGRSLIAGGWSAEAAKPMSLITAMEFTVFGTAMLLPKRRLGDLAFVTLTFVGIFFRCSCSPAICTTSRFFTSRSWLIRSPSTRR